MSYLTADELEAVGLTLRVAGWAIAGSLAPAVLCAWVLARARFWGKPLVDGLVHLPLVVPPVLTGYLLLVILGTQGPVGGLLRDVLGIRLVFTTAGAVVATAVMTFPLMVRAIRLAIEAIDPGLEAAARTLGAGPIGVFFTVTLPLMLPGIVAGAVVAFAAGLGEFGAVITFVSNIPGETRTLPLAIYTATQTPAGDPVAARLASVSLTLALAGLLLSEVLARRVRRLIGR